MLVLSRKLNESIRISDQITVSVLKVQGNRVYLGIDAPAEVKIVRGEIAANPLPTLEHNRNSGPAAGLCCIR